MCRMTMFFMFESWPCVTWPWPDLWCAPPLRPFSEVVCLSKGFPDKKKHLESFISAGVIVKHSKNEIFHVSPRFDLTRDLDLKFICFWEFTTRSTQRRLSLVATSRGSRDIFGGQNPLPPPPTGEGRQIPTGRGLTWQLLGLLLRREGALNAHGR